MCRDWGWEVPIYRIEVTLGQATETRLVEAKTEASALKHAGAKYMKAEIVRSAGQMKEAMALASKGVTVETAATE